MVLTNVNMYCEMNNNKISVRQYHALRKDDTETIEKIFNVSLENRTYSLSIMLGQAELSFFDKDNMFGYIERLPVDTFLKKLDELGLYIRF